MTCTFLHDSTFSSVSRVSRPINVRKASTALSFQEQQLIGPELKLPVPQTDVHTSSRIYQPVQQKAEVFHCNDSETSFC